MGHIFALKTKPDSFSIKISEYVSAASGADLEQHSVMGSIPEVGINCAFICRR